MTKNTTTPSLVTVPSIFLQEVKKLTAFSGETCVSLYIPTSATNPDPRTNSIVFKNAVTKALEILNELKPKDPTIETLLTLRGNLLEDELFWKEQAACLAVFVSGEKYQIYTLAQPHQELLMINTHYYVLPLILHLDTQFTFYVLELDKEYTQMWKGTENSLEKVQVPNLPTSIAEVTGVEQNERQLQFHSSNLPGGAGGDAAVFHGSSSWKDDKDKYLERFLHAVDNAVTAYFKVHEYPLLLAGREEPIVLFRGISKYKHVLPETLPQNPDPAHKSKDLHQKSWEVASNYIEEQKQKLLHEYQETLPAKKVSVLPEILRQAAQGMVQTLLVAEDAHVWGIFDSETLSPVIEEKQQPLSSELLNEAARLTLLQSGEVRVLPNTQMPDNAVAAAVLRF